LRRVLSFDLAQGPFFLPCSGSFLFTSLKVLSFDLAQGPFF